MTSRQLIAEVEREQCHCLACGVCNGRGYLPTFDYRALMDESDTCDECGGSGLAEVCDRCQLLEDLDHGE
jgi:hypothetical protein